eukprot:1668076-Prymnesium_polylepis.1
MPSGSAGCSTHAPSWRVQSRRTKPAVAPRPPAVVAAAAAVAAVPTMAARTAMRMRRAGVGCRRCSRHTRPLRREASAGATRASSSW